MMVVKAILLVIIELLVYWVTGAFVAGFVSRKKQMGIGLQTVAGFLCYQILFQVFSFPFIITKRWFNELVTCWLIAIVLFLAVSVFVRRKLLWAQVKSLIGIVKKQPMYLVLGGLAVIVFCYYVVMNGRLDDDSVYYIGLANTTVDLNIMFRSNVYTGELQPSLYLRRIFTTFEINAAMLAKVFSIHPIIVMRVTRACLNVILSVCSIFEIGKMVYCNLEETARRKKSIAFTMIALYANFLMEKTIFTNATFLLHRAYEGKAYAASTLVLFAIVICLRLVRNKQREDFIWLILLLWASTAVSTTAIVINLGIIGMWLTAQLLVKFVGRMNKVEEQNAGR